MSKSLLAKLPDRVRSRGPSSGIILNLTELDRFGLAFPIFLLLCMKDKKGVSPKKGLFLFSNEWEDIE